MIMALVDFFRVCFSRRTVVRAGWGYARGAALGLLCAVSALAQTVHWEPSDSGMPNTVQLVFENCGPDGDPQLPALPGVTFAFLGQSENTQMSFGTGGASRLRTVTLSYLLRSRQNAPVQIPAFTVKTDKGPLRVAAFNAAAPAAPLESVASAKLVPERTRVWAGEVFGLTYELSATRRTNPQISPTFDWNAAPLIAEDWSKPEVTEAVVNNERRLNVVFRTRAVAKTPNTIKLEAASHLLSIQTGTIGFGIISQPRMEQVSVTSDQPNIEVRPLPTGAPPGFNGAVGQFKLTSKIVPEKAAVGEPVTWTIELSGTGNWPDIAGLPSREVSNDFQVVQPKAKRTPAETKLFDVTLAEDVVLVPTKAGSYALGPVAFSYFDPKSGTYKTVSAPRTVVAISAPSTPQFNLGPGPGRPAAEPNAGPADKPAVAPAAPPPPAAIPRDPLPGQATARVPLAARTVVLAVVAPLGALLLFWFGLAVRRAKQTDPIRPRREARDNLARILAHFTSAPAAERLALLREWERDTAILWQLAHAAPPAAALPDAAWATLWREADRALYGADHALPSDWTARAQEALAAKTVPGFRPLRLFLPQNLMPFAAALAVMSAVSAVVLHAAERDAAQTSYRSGDFAAAEKAWRTRIAAAPTDWIARHNLSLALAQQEKTGEAVAQATAAFVQNPSDLAVRWHFGITAEKAGAAPPTLSAFITPGPLQSLGRLASAAHWQFVAIAGAWLAAIALGWLLWNSYGRRSTAATWVAAGLLLVSALAGVAAAAGVRSYGDAANPAAVIVARASTLRSIPTEADTTQKTSPLPMGSLAIADLDNTYLRWTRLSFGNGQTGWVRNEDFVMLWK
jgi:hypothetical protein